MTVALNYQSEAHGETIGDRPGLVAAIIALGIANIDFPCLWAWAYLEMPPFAFSAGGFGTTEIFAVVFLAAWAALSILLALWGVYSCLWYPRRLAVLLMGSFAITLNGIYALVLVRSLMP
jgi:hypothetical protein